MCSIFFTKRKEREMTERITDVIAIIIIAIAVYIIAVVIIVLALSISEKRQAKKISRSEYAEYEKPINESSFICGCALHLAKDLAVEILQKDTYFQLRYKYNDYIEVKNNLDKDTTVEQFYIEIIKIAREKGYLDGSLKDAAIGYMGHYYDIHSKIPYMNCSLDLILDKIYYCLSFNYGESL